MARDRRDKQEKKSPGGQESYSTTVHALDSKIRIVAQKLNVIEKNEKVIGQTLVTLNKKLRDIEEGGGTASSKDLEELKKKMDAVTEQVEKIKAIIEMIDPTQFVTAKDLQAALKKTSA